MTNCFYSFIVSVIIVLTIQLNSLKICATKFDASSDASKLRMENRCGHEQKASTCSSTAY